MYPPPGVDVISPLHGHLNLHCLNASGGVSSAHLGQMVQFICYYHHRALSKEKELFKKG